MKHPTAAQFAALKTEYRAGTTCRRAAASADVSLIMAEAAYAGFRRDGVSRGPLRRFKSAELPRYHGPEMIGQAIGDPPTPEGPDWIGTAA